MLAGLFNGFAVPLPEIVTREQRLNQREVGCAIAFTCDGGKEMGFNCENCLFNRNRGRNRDAFREWRDAKDVTFQYLKNKGAPL